LRADFVKLDRAFNPKCVAVIGDSDQFMWLHGHSHFKGKLYSVQVNPQTAQQIESQFNIKNYTSVLNIPEPVDLAIVAVNRRVAMRVLDDCIRKDVTAAYFFTSGYSETETEEGRQYERQFKEKAEAASFHLIGPNCMGIFNPKVGLKQVTAQYHDKWGPVGFISQSGTHAIAFSMDAHLQGIDINKSISFGNGIVLDSPEYLKYFGQDRDTKIIGMYLEGLKDGRRFAEVLKKVSARKPVVIWKGGRTESGSRAIASHTGSMAVPLGIWESAMKQFGAVPVKNLEELIDTLKILLYLEPPKGKRVGLTGGSGGQSVAITDAFTEEGLDVPRLTKASYDELASFYNVIGGGYGNPIDTGNTNRTELNRIMSIIERDANIDNIVVLIGLRMGDTSDIDTVQGGTDSVIELRKHSRKPVLAAINTSFLPGGPPEVRRLMEKLQAGGVPAFSSIERAARALRNAVYYYRDRNGSTS
jgi:acyl-CoA synthetase (NDP forming)